jgi:hypothetical protein
MLLRDSGERGLNCVNGDTKASPIPGGRMDIVVEVVAEVEGGSCYD